MTDLKELVLYPNHIKKLLETKTPKGRNAKMDAECGVFEKIFLNNKKKDNSNFEKYFLGYFDSLGYSKTTIKKALRFLEKMGFIKKSIKTISTGNVVRSVLYVKLELENIVVALKEKGLDNVCIGDKKMPINKRKHTTYAINKCGTLKDTTINNVKNGINIPINPYINSNNPSNISNSTFSDTINTPNNTNILTNINNIPMEYIQSPTPIKKPSIYKKNNNTFPLGDKNGGEGGGIELWQLEGIEIEAREALIKSGLKFENATVNAISVYLYNKNDTFNSKQALKSYINKIVDSLHKIQLEFKEAGISMKNLPTGYEPKYKSFTYQAQSIEADSILLNKINELAKTNFNLSVLETSIYNSYGTFSKPEYLINYLVQCFKKQPNVEQYHTPESTYPYQPKKPETDEEKEASRLRMIEWLNKNDEEQRAKNPNHKSWHERYDY